MTVLVERFCSVCGNGMMGRRDKYTCSARCRKQLSRLMVKEVNNHQVGKLVSGRKDAACKTSRIPRKKGR